MAMTVDLPVLQRTDAGTPRAPSARWRRYARPLLGQVDGHGHSKTIS